MRPKHLITWIVFLSLFAMSARISLDTDTWWHLRAGKWIVENQAVPMVDYFSHTRLGADWHYPGWLFQAPMYLIYNRFGAGGLNLMTAALVTLAFSFIWRVMSGGPLLRAFSIILAGTVSGVYWAARPYLVTFLLAAVFLFLLEQYRWRPSPASTRWLWLLPLLMVVWANSHGGFVVGFLLWGVYWFSESIAWLAQGNIAPRLKKIWQEPHRWLQPGAILSWVGLCLALAVCVNPSGPEMLAYPLKTVSIGALQEYIQEWQSPDFHSLSVQPFAWLLLLTFGAAGFSRRRMALTDFLLAAGFAYMGLMAGRNIALFALAAPLVFTRHAQEFSDQAGEKLKLQTGAALPRRLALLNIVLILIVAFAAALKAASVYPNEVNEQALRKSLPLDAVTFLQKDLPPGKLFNSYNWGGYLLWALPQAPVAIDGRTDLYDDEIISQWLQVTRVEGDWQQVLQRWGIGWVLVESGSELHTALLQSGWQVLYQDQLAVVIGR